MVKEDLLGLLGMTTSDGETSPTTIGIYTAGPLGFFEAGRTWHDGVLLPALRSQGWVPLDPWAAAALTYASISETPSLDELAAANVEVGRTNEDMIRSCQAVLAVLDGSDVESGTAAAIGFAAALGKPIIGLRTDIRVSGDNAAAAVNLQVMSFILRSGGSVVRSLDDSIVALATILGYR